MDRRRCGKCCLHWTGTGSCTPARERMLIRPGGRPSCGRPGQRSGSWHSPTTSRAGRPPPARPASTTSPPPAGAAASTSSWTCCGGPGRASGSSSCRRTGAATGVPIRRRNTGRWPGGWSMRAPTSCSGIRRMSSVASRCTGAGRSCTAPATSSMTMPWIRGSAMTFPSSSWWRPTAGRLGGCASIPPLSPTFQARLAGRGAPESTARMARLCADLGTGSSWNADAGCLEIPLDRPTAPPRPSPGSDCP